MSHRIRAGRRGGGPGGQGLAGPADPVMTARAGPETRILRVRAGMSGQRNPAAAVGAIWLHR